MEAVVAGESYQSSPTVREREEDLYSGVIPHLEVEVRDSIIVINYITLITIW